MSVEGRDIPPMGGGQPIQATAMKALTDAGSRARNAAGDEHIALEMVDGSVVGRWVGPPIPPLGQDMAVVKAIEKDCLMCHTWDATQQIEGMTDFYVALPPELQWTPWNGKTIDGLTYNYTSNTAMTTTKVSDSTTESHVIVPPYRLPGGSFVGSLIYIDCNCPRGLGVTDPNGNMIIWRDKNEDGRGWGQVSS